MGKLIGRGGFGTVHKALNVNTGQIVAIKRFHAAKITKSKLAAVMVRTHPVRAGRWCVVWDQSQLTPIARVRSLTLCRQAEADVLEKLNHSNVVKFIGYVKTQDFLHLVLEYVEEGALSDVLKDYGRFPENITALYTAQMLKGLAYLHEQRVIHRDIKGCVKKKKKNTGTGAAPAAAALCLFVVHC
jgi:serine/threonine protein kinase